MKNLVHDGSFETGKVYMFEMKDGEVNSYRFLSETPTHLILSFSNFESVEVFDKAKTEIISIYDVKEWLHAQKN